MVTLYSYASCARGSVYQKLLIGIAWGLCVVIAGCTKSDDALQSSANTPQTQVVSREGKLVENQQVDQTKDQSGAKIIREKSTVSKKGTGIKVLVNRAPITNYDISRRAAFLRLRRIGGNRTEKATNELIEEQLKMQEAAKLRTLASDSIVDKAFADFSKRNRLSPKKMGGILNQAGVTSKHFKEFLRAQISWQRTVATKLRSNTRAQSQSDALFTLRKSGEAKPETREYRLQQIIFVVPQAKRKKLLRQRSTEAKSYSQRFSSCGETLGQLKSLRDVTYKDLGRVLEPELPPRWKDDIINTAVGKTTRTKETEKGVELIAVCSVRSISDDRVAEVVTRSKEFASLNSKGDKTSDDYLRELRSKATIIYR